MDDHTVKFYEIAAKEVASKQVIPGLMAKAFADSNGDQRATIATYIRLRAGQLEGQFQQEQRVLRQRRREEAERELARRDLAHPPSLACLLGRFFGKYF